MDQPLSAEDRSRLSALMADFQRLANPQDFAYPWCHTHNGGKHPFHVVFGVMIHGNEFGSLPAAVRLVQALRSGELQPKGRVTVFIGNPEAARENRRYLEADLNRVFLDTGLDQHEHRRARALMPILDSADVFIDFHQTILQTRQPFYIFPWNPTGWHWARSIQSAKVWVTRDPKVRFSASSRCSDEYVCLQDKPGLTVELSEKGFSQAAEALCLQSMLATIQCADDIATGTATVAQTASRQPDLSFFQTTHMEAFATPEHALRAGLVNFQAVQAGEQISAKSTPEMCVPDDGMLLFPKYPPRDGTAAVAPLPGEIYRLITPIPVHPTQLWGED